MNTPGPTRKTALVSPTRRSLPLTLDDSKILGKTTERRREKAVPPDKFQSRKFRTLTSTWTPIVHKPSNSRIFLERRDLVLNWYELWTDYQRKCFLDALFRQTHRSQLLFIQYWFHEHVPLRHLDFTQVLPLILSKYIFSFLDPRSLSRAAMVSWHWNFVTSQDAVWMSKCQRRGWYLPYTPGDNEFGAWKRHYVACIRTMDMNVPSKNQSDLYGTIGDGTKIKNDKKQKGNRLTLVQSREVLHSRPPWQPPDKTPRDLDRAAKSLLEDHDPNDPQVHPALLSHHNKFGIVRTGLLRSSAPGSLREHGLQMKGRYSQHRILEAEDDPDLQVRQQTSLSRSLELESFEERRMMDLVRQPWEPPVQTKSPIQPRPNLAGGGDYPLPWKHNTRQPISKSYPNQPNPRVVFISSRVPAAEVLVDAVMFGVIPIVYEYEGTTLQSLMSQLDICLQGRNAQSIGFFAHSEFPWEMRIVYKATITMDNIETAEYIEFFETISSHVLPSAEGGHIDLFLPLAACEQGVALMTQLNTSTGMTYSAPTGIVGNYNHVNSEWASKPEGVAPPTHYFCSSKLNLWANTADQVQEACQVTKKLVSRFFEQKQKDVVSQLVGQIVFDAVGETALQGSEDIAAALVDGLIQMGKEQNVKRPLEYLAGYLLEKSDTLQPGEDVNAAVTRTRNTKSHKASRGGATGGPADLLSSHLELDEPYNDSLMNSENTDDYDSEVAHFTQKKRKQKINQNLHGDAEESDDEIPEDEIDEDIVEDIAGSDSDQDDVEGMRQQRKMPKPKRSKSPSVTKGLSLKGTKEWDEGLQTYDSMPTSRSQKAFGGKTPRRITTDRLKDQPEKRTPIAWEILASEVEYMRTLEILEKVFVLPLKSAMGTNRAIVSAHNLQIIFSDAMTLLGFSRSLVSDLKKRMADWGPKQCLGDIFVKFTSNLKAYANFLNNYPTILTTIERSSENSPQFRAYLKRNERTPATKMRILAELLLAPCRRINEYATLLTWIETYTPRDHADRADLKLAIKTLADFDDLIRDCKKRSETERELISLQKSIIKCPVLLEANRFLIRQQDLAHLRPPIDSEDPEQRLYQHIETLGFFLFNDGLLVTRRVTRHTPFQYAREYSYVFNSCCGLVRLKIEDIPDSKYVRNAFRMYTPSKSWVCQAEDFDTKYNWVTLIENAIRAALKERD